jgi:PAS domain S-box-containing protein
MKERFDEGDALTRSGAEEQSLHPRFVDLGNLISNRFEVAHSAVNEREKEGLEGVRKLLAANPGIESISKIERTVKNIVDTEDSLLRERDQQQHLHAQAAKMTVYTGLAVNFVLLAFALGLIRDDLAARRRAALAMEAANAQLEAKVQERTSELVNTNQSLKLENLERRWSYQALDHQLRYNQLVINSIAEIIFVISRALNISRVNPAAVQQTGWEPQELIAQSIERVLQLPPDPASTQNPFAAAMKDGREIQGRPALLLTRSGGTIPILFSIIPLHDHDKVVGGVITVRAQNAAAQKGR